MLITLDDKDKLKSAEQVDRLVSAEVPDPSEDPALYQVVKENMIHGPAVKESDLSVTKLGAVTKTSQSSFATFL